MDQFNDDFYEVLIEDRRRDATEFFRKQHLARLQRQQKPLPLPSNEQKRPTGFRIGINLKAIGRSIRILLRTLRKRAESYATK